MKTVVIYHRADFDGIFCREIARKFLPDAELIGWDYGDALLAFPGSGTVYVLDLSPDCFEPGMGFHSGRERLIWIDHHRSAIEKYPEGIYGYRIDGVAACRLAWQWFTKDHTDVVVQFLGLPSKEEFVQRKVIEPAAVRLAGEYDVWDKRDPDAELFQHGLRSVPLTDGIWAELLEPRHHNFTNDLLHRGESVQYAKERENESIIKGNGFTVEWEGLKFLACNAARYNSHLFSAGLTPEHDGCLGFNWTGKDWRVSLYGVPGKPEVDLAAIAVRHGGGGHKQACGFRCERMPFLK